MTEDRETSKHPDSNGTKNLSIIEGGKTKTTGGKSKGHTRQRSAPSALTGLTDKQETFVQCIVDGMSQRDAYKEAYNAAGMAPQSIDVEAWKLIRNPKVSQRLIALEGEIEAKRRALSISRWDRTVQFYESSMLDENLHHSIRTRNAELLGKHLGLFVDRVETKDVTEQSAEDIEARIKAKLGIA